MYRFALVLVLVIGCQPKPGQQPPPAIPLGQVITCGTQAVAQHAPEALPAVNECLRDAGDVSACLLGLVQPAVGITIDVIACVVRHEGAAARASAQANPNNTADACRAQRSRDFIERHQFRFMD